MRALWTHNFDPSIPNNLVFVETTAQAVSAHGVKVEVEYLGNLRSVSRLLKARRQVRKMADGFDIVHAQFGSACALATAGVEGKPKVLTIRGSDWSVHSSSIGYEYFHARVSTLFTKTAIATYEGVISVSRRVVEELRRAAPRAHMMVLPSPVDVKRFVPRDRKEAKALLGYPDCAEKWVLFNSLDLANPVKRFPLAKRAFEIAQSKMGNLRLRVATDLPHESMPLFVAACDVILCTSENEGWPNCVKEALSCGVPFVATDVSDLRDIAVQESVCRVCPPDPAVIAENICDVLQTPIQATLRRYAETMSQEAIGKSIVSMYETLCTQFNADGRVGARS
ncbi:MAG: glycosyltransferase [Gammaproteobacteria bacterium]